MELFAKALAMSAVKFGITIFTTRPRWLVKLARGSLVSDYAKQ